MGFFLPKRPEKNVRDGANVEVAVAVDGTARWEIAVEGVMAARTAGRALRISMRPGAVAWRIVSGE